MSFDPYNCPLKIQVSIGTRTPKMGVHLGVWGFIPSHSLALLGTWNVTPRLHSWPTPLQTLILVTSPRLGLRHWRCYIIKLTLEENPPITIKFMNKKCDNLCLPCPCVAFVMLIRFNNHQNHQINIFSPSTSNMRTLALKFKNVLNSHWS
jgi:hypothetical protein